MSRRFSLVCWALVIIGALLVDNGSYGWRRRRRRRSCATNSCTWRWGSCSRTCGGGTQNPIKLTSQGPCGSCNMPSSSRACNTHCCAVNCAWRSWGSWGSCSRPCGGGTQTRNRGKNGPSCGGRACSGSSSDTRSCNQQCCPVNCAWAAWSSWVSCSLTCGGGTQTRSRGYGTSATCGGRACPGYPGETRACNSQCCPVDCAWSDWSRWSRCTAVCGGGTQFRERGQDPVMSCGGSTCIGSPSDRRECNEHCCPINCAWGNWGEWSECSKSCGKGSRGRDRTIAVPAFCGGGRCFGPSKQTQFCNEQCCPVDCEWGMWEPWGTCSKTCERGDQSRRRSVSVEVSCGGDACGGLPSDTRTCNDVCCPVHCQWDEWSRWTSCTKTCGSGRRNRRRAVKIDAVCNGEECTGSTDETEICNTMCCPVDCILSDWGEWSECTSTCGARGLKIRQRKVTRELSCGGSPCDKVLVQENACNRVCFNGGSVGQEACLCDVGWTQDCCEHDVDECDFVNCTANSYCVNADGSYDCVCEHGYSKDGRECKDVDECHLEMHDCHEEAECINIKGHYSCSCNPGFTGDGVTCSDIDECWLENQNTTDSGSDIDESADYRSPLCHDDAQCGNSYGSYVCTCNQGYNGDGVTCSDTDECSLMKTQKVTTTEEYRSSTVDDNSEDKNSISIKNCDAHAGCMNSPGSYACWCNNGYFGDGFICHEIDECESSPCANSGTCLDIVNSFQCVCQSGFTDPLCETDIDECSLMKMNTSSVSEIHSVPGEKRFPSPTSCSAHSSCANTAGSYVCFCDDGYYGDGFSCQETNECQSAPCQNDGSCLDMINSFQCSCTPGYTGRLCESDINECNFVSCTANSYCVNTDGSYDCVCHDGYLKKEGRCEDVDECYLMKTSHIDWSTTGTTTAGRNIVTKPRCSSFATCTNSQGSYACGCNAGYHGDGFTCQEINECESDPCQNGGRCLDLVNSFKCTCWPGFTGPLCESDIDECLRDYDQSGNGMLAAAVACHSEAVCVNTHGSYDCFCTDGYTGDGFICNDVDECEILKTRVSGSGNAEQDLSGSGMVDSASHREYNINDCDVHALCSNYAGGYSCSCKTGYQGNGFACHDIHECDIGTHSCDQERGICLNTEGSHICTCKDGFTGNGVKCADIDECALRTDDCDKRNGVCINSIGSYSCICKDGFTGNGVVCTDIDECSSGTHDCDAAHGVCSNTAGTHTCHCISGFSGDGRICSDIDECVLGFHSCKGDHQICVNSAGHYACGCEEFFTKEEDECLDVDECKAEGEHCKGENEVCQNYIGGFKCVCPDGYQMDNGECKDIDECSIGSKCNGEYQSCKNTGGSFECICQESLDMKDGICVERVPEMQHMPGAKPQDTNLVHTSLSPVILIVVGLAVVIIVATIFITVRILKRRTTASPPPTSNVSGSVFNNMSFVNTENPPETEENL